MTQCENVGKYVYEKDEQMVKNRRRKCDNCIDHDR